MFPNSLQISCLNLIVGGCVLAVLQSWIAFAWAFAQAPVKASLKMNYLLSLHSRQVSAASQVETLNVSTLLVHRIAKDYFLKYILKDLLDERYPRRKVTLEELELGIIDKK